MFFCFKPSYYLIQLPHYCDQVLTGILPYGDSNEADVITNVKHSKQPPRPTDPNQNQWLQDRVWDTITTCWSDKPQQRCELSVVHHIFSTSSSQDLLIELPPVGRENLIQLADELLYTFLVLPLDPDQRTALRTTQEYISDVISRDGTPPTILSSAEVVALMKPFHEVPFPC